MKKILAIVLASTSLFAGAAEVGGVKLDDAVKVAGHDLVFNGGGIRTKYGFAKVYVGALYAAQKTNNADAVVNAVAPRRVVLSMLRRVEAEKLHESLIEGLEDNTTEAEFSALQPRLKEMNAIFQGVKEVKEGDLIVLDFLPGKGTQITVRGQIKDVLAGDELARALLRVWLGKKPVSDSLKAGMLGNK